MHKQNLNHRVQSRFLTLDVVVLAVALAGVAHAGITDDYTYDLVAVTSSPAWQGAGLGIVDAANDLIIDDYFFYLYKSGYKFQP